ncbi:MAG: tetratricopeptide repeat protein [Gemmatimonadaceae bacterium]
MTPGDRATAQTALTEGRGVYGRLDQIRGPEDAAADILNLWRAAESAMRAMLGGSTLSGQGLVRELRQRGTLNLEQANALASFWDARARVDDVGYKPTLTDVGYARVGYNELTAALADPSAKAASAATIGATSAASSFSAPRVPPTPIPSASAATPAAARFAPGTTTGPPVVPPPLSPGTVRPVAEPVRASRRRRLSPLLAGGLVLLAVIVAVAAYLMSGGSSYNREMDTAAELLRTGREESARAAFNKIARENPTQSKPHVFLARFARQDGDPSTARQELETAIRLNPADELAQREMGLLLLSQNDPQLAFRFFARAVKLDASDLAAQGYAGCSLLRLNLIDQGQRLLSRAGPGTWSSCTAVPPPITTPPTKTTPAPR